MSANSKTEMREAATPYQGSKWHRFFVVGRYTNMKLAFKASLAVMLTLAIGQADNVSKLEGSTLYVSTIFATLLMANKPRVQTIELTLVAGVLMGAVIPYTMLGYLCAKATRDPARDASSARVYAAAILSGDSKNASPATFYQPQAAAVAGVFLFMLAWAANVAKTIFLPFTFAIVAATIVGGILFIEGYLFPQWSQFYTIVKQVLYCAYIGVASATAVSLFIFPYNAREPYLSLTSKFLDTVEKLISKHADHFSNGHIRYREHLNRVNATSVDSSTAASDASQDRVAEHADAETKDAAPDPIAVLHGLRAALTAISAAHAMAKDPAKREVAYGHMRGSELEEMHKHCRNLLVPVFGCNLWSQVSDVMNKDRASGSKGPGDKKSFLDSLGAEMDGGSEEEARLYDLMAARIAPRIRSLSSSCTDAITHIQHLLHLGVYARPPFYARPFVSSPASLTEAELTFGDQFEADLAAFWADKHVEDREAFRLRDGRPHVASLLILYMESTMYAVGSSLLSFVRWAEDQHRKGTMTSRRLIVPKPKRYTKAIRRSLKQLSQHFRHDTDAAELSGAGMRDVEDTYEVEVELEDASDAFLVQAKPPLIARNGMFSGVFLVFYRLRTFMFQSSVSAFGFRAAIAMTAGALPAFFPDSVSVFLRYRLIWITFTVLLGLQPVLGKGIAASLFRIVGTIIGGVAGLVVLEVGRVAGGRLPLFFLTLLGPFYVFQLDPKKYLITVLLTVITEDLVVGYELEKDTLGLMALELSGQAYLAPPAVMGYRILLTLAGIIIAMAFSIFPTLPTARNLLRENVAKHFFLSSDTYLLCEVRRAAERFELPKDIDKAIVKKQAESLALSAAASDLLSLTGFEPSLAGTFPKQEWSDFLLLLNNFNSAMAVFDALYARLEKGGQQHNLAQETGGVIYRSNDDYRRVVTATLVSIGSALSVWRPIAPTMESPVVAHHETRKRLYELSDAIGDLRDRGLLSADTLTHYGASNIVSALMSRYLEDLLAQTAVLVGQSGFKTYLSSHRKGEKVQ